MGVETAMVPNSEASLSEQRPEPETHVRLTHYSMSAIRSQSVALRNKHLAAAKRASEPCRRCLEVAVGGCRMNDGNA